MRRARILEVPQHRDAGELGNGLLEQLQSFASQIHRDGGDPGDVSARPRQAVDQAIRDRIAGNHKNDRGRLGSFLQSQRFSRRGRNQHVHVETDQLFSQDVEPVALIFRGLRVSRESFVLAIPRAERMEISLDSRQRGTRTGS